MHPLNVNFMHVCPKYAPIDMSWKKSSKLSGQLEESHDGNERRQVTVILL